MRRRFSREYDYPRCPLVRRLAVLSRFSNPGCCPELYLRASTAYSVRRRRCHSSVTPWLSSRVSLRARLTPGRLTSPGKPWAFGVRVSRPHCRYLCLHFLFRTLQPASQLTFGADRNAPLPLSRVHGFGSVLDARLSSTQLRSTSELLRTL